MNHNFEYIKGFIDGAIKAYLQEDIQVEDEKELSWTIKKTPTGYNVYFSYIEKYFDDEPILNEDFELEFFYNSKENKVLKELAVALQSIAEKDVPEYDYKENYYPNEDEDMERVRERLKEIISYEE